MLNPKLPLLSMFRAPVELAVPVLLKVNAAAPVFCIVMAAAEDSVPPLLLTLMPALLLIFKFDAELKEPLLFNVPPFTLTVIDAAALVEMLAALLTMPVAEFTVIPESDFKMSPAAKLLPAAPVAEVLNGPPLKLTVPAPERSNVCPAAGVMLKEPPVVCKLATFPAPGAVTVRLPAAELMLIAEAPEALKLLLLFKRRLDV